MLQEFKDHIAKEFSFLFGGKLLIACSGGVDSVVLVNLCRLLKFDFGIAHCNFKLRDVESDQDELFVKDIADRFEVGYYVTNFDTDQYAKEHKLSIQMAARELRYQWFNELVAIHHYNYVLTAHHADDVLETFLINMSRGTGIEGLTGIPKKNGFYIRPMLPFSSEQILKFAKKKHICWREDSSNKSIKYLRNQLRHEVIPALKAVNPQFMSNFETTLQNLKQTEAFVKERAVLLKKELFIKEEEGQFKIPIGRLLHYYNPKPYLYFLLKEYGFTAWDDIGSLLYAQPGKQIFSPSHRLIKDRDYLLLARLNKVYATHDYHIPEGETTVMLPNGTLRFKLTNEEFQTAQETIYVDKEKLKYPLIVRKWKEGDYFYPFGMQGKKKLSKYFKDEKLSLLAKERIWLLCSGDKIVWIMNQRADNRFRITPKTKQKLKITITR